jgi:hypothetical protein
MIEDPAEQSQEHGAAPSIATAMPEPRAPLPSEDGAVAFVQSEPVSPAPKSSQRRFAWAVPVAAGVVALAAGAGLGIAIGRASVDPTQSSQYQALQADVTAAQSSMTAARRSATEAEASASQAGAAAVSSAQASASQAATAEASRSAALDQREAAIAARESAVAAAEHRIAATSIGGGTYTVGRDVEPGTYRAKDAVSSDCYWAITTSGTNGADIIENDIPGGGYPTVALKAGEDFTNTRCGTFIKQ